MQLSQPKTIEDYVITLLRDRPLPIIELIERIQKLRGQTTKQGVYVVIRRLKKQETIVVHNKLASLSSVWLSHMEAFFAEASQQVQDAYSPQNMHLGLKPGEKIQYNFKNPILTDAFWSHVFLSLVNTSSAKNPVLIYNPHEWFILARNENETDLFKKITSRGQQLAVLVGGDTPLDIIAKKLVRKTGGLFDNVSSSFLPNQNHYINIIGNHIIEVWIDKKVASQIQQFFETKQKFGETEKIELEQILMQKGKNKFVITNNKRKADGYRKKFKKYFFLKF